MDEIDAKQLPNSASENGEALSRSLSLTKFAGEMGYEGEAPNSILDIIKATGKVSGAEYIPILIKAHDAGLLSHEVSSHTVDSLRYLLESTPQEPRTTTFYQLAQAQELDICGQEVLDRWNDLEILLGINRQTSKATLDDDGQKPINERAVRYPDNIHSGAITFETQGGGQWGYRTNWDKA
jgi:hypothetical protein